MKLHTTLKLVIAIAVAELSGVVGSLFTASSVSNWYTTLQKSSLNPPAWVFGPVWVTLYALMGVSLWLVWKSNTKEKGRAMWIFAAQLFLNALWSPVFFGAHAIGSALVVIVLLWAAIVLTISIFKNVSKVAAWLLVPYILWVSFAIYLNYNLWLLNR